MLAVVCSIIREARCSIMISYSLFKYMVLYGFIESMVGCVAFFVAHTNLSIPQVTPPRWHTCAASLYSFCGL